MPNEILDNVIFEIENRIFPEGGLADHIGGEYRPDATAWAVLAFGAFRKDTHIIEQALSRFLLNNSMMVVCAFHQNTLTHSGLHPLQFLHGMDQRALLTVDESR